MPRISTQGRLPGEGPAGDNVQIRRDKQVVSLMTRG